MKIHVSVQSSENADGLINFKIVKSNNKYFLYFYQFVNNNISVGLSFYFLAQIQNTLK